MLISMDPASSAPTQGAADGERRACFNCDFINAAVAAACEHCGANLRGVPLQRDLKMEAHLTAIAMWFRICGYLMALPALILVIMGIGLAGLGPLVVGTLIRMVGSLPVLGLGLAGILLGVYLGRFSNIARITAGVLTVMATTGQVGTVIFLFPYKILMTIELFLGFCFFSVFMIAVLLALFNRRAAVVCSEGYRRLVDFRRGVPPGTYRSPFFWVPFVGLAVFIAPLIASLMTPLRP
jgi:hypothetical protein